MTCRGDVTKVRRGPGRSQTPTRVTTRHAGVTKASAERGGLARPVQRAGLRLLGDHLRVAQEGAVLELDQRQLLHAGQLLDVASQKAQRRVLDQLVLDAGLVQRVLGGPAGMWAL